MRLERGTKNYRRSIDFTEQKSRGFNYLKDEGLRSSKNMSPLVHDPLVNPMPFNNQNPYMETSKALEKKDPLVKEYGLPRVNSTVIVKK